ncbi:hypothetical protein ACJMK2_001139 [Sinanodonta woodiana]|uniref:Uncharacterized protein n=1 Tax=Sinanodonta woodiana TaxID=1069815 RepID=A0ABD3XRD9_SINWO
MVPVHTHSNSSNLTNLSRLTTMLDAEIWGTGFCHISKLAYWKKPSKQISRYKELSCLDFRSATKLKQLTDNPDADATPYTPYRILNLSAVPATEISDRKQILQILEKNNKKPAIMTLVEPFCEKFKPPQQGEHLLSSLFTLRNENTDSMSLGELLDYCSKLDISITNEQVDAVEKETHLQNKCKLWHRVREGRITSTTLHSVCHTNPEAPSISLLKYLTSASVSVQTSQMVWGVKMEDVAKRQYTGKMIETHDLFSINPCFFVVFFAPRYAIHGFISRWDDILCVLLEGLY